MRPIGEASVAVFMCLLVAASVRAQGADTYIAVDLTPAGFVESRAVGASSGSQVGFGFGAATFGAERALLWLGTAASAVDLHPPGGYQTSNALAASGTTQVGWATHPETFTPHAFVWQSSADTGVDLHPADMSYSFARGASGDAQVGWGAGPATGFFEHALLWRGSAATVVDLNPPGFVNSRAFAASADQQVGVGDFSRALLWTGTAESAVDLTPFSCIDAAAFGVSGGQQIGRCRAAPDFNQHAFLWTGTAESAVDLNPAGFFFSEAQGVANNRQVGFGASFGGPTRALVWSGTADSVVDLNQFLPSGFTDAVALGIDERGNIVGWAREAAGGQFLHAFLWIPQPRETLVAIDIKPGTQINSVNPRSNGRIPVAILSTADFDAFALVERSSLRFGHTGDEASLASCSRTSSDVNGDGLHDLICHFVTNAAAFGPDDASGTLTGTTIDGAAIRGTDSVRIVPDRPN